MSAVPFPRFRTEGQHPKSLGEFGEKTLAPPQRNFFPAVGIVGSLGPLQHKPQINAPEFPFQ